MKNFVVKHFLLSPMFWFLVVMAVPCLIAGETSLLRSFVVFFIFWKARNIIFNIIGFFMLADMLDGFMSHEKN